MPLEPALLIQQVADDFDISYGELIGDGRSADLVDARAVVVRILRARGWSFPRIGRILGNRDHSTVINLHQKYHRYQTRNSIVAESFARHAHLAVPQPQLVNMAA